MEHLQLSNVSEAPHACRLRRGFKVFQRVCSGCHGAIHQKYDLLVDKGFKQRELMVISFTLTR